MGDVMKDKKQRKFFHIFCGILVCAFVLITFFVIRDAYSLKMLKDEVSALQKLDVTKDRYNREIKTSGGYRIVEVAIKEYLDSYALGIQEVSNISSSEKLKQILSYQNYETDGPNFKESITYLNDTKAEYNNRIDFLLENLEEDSIRSYINNRTSSSYYRSLYVQLMLEDDMMDDLKETRKILSDSKEKMNTIYDTCLDVLNFLILYQDSWSLENGEIRFSNQDLYDYYVGLIGKISN